MSTQTPPGILLYADMWPALSKLSDHQFRAVIQALVALLGACEKPELDDVTDILFEAFKPRQEFNFKRYEEISEKRRKAGAKGGAARIANQANQANEANQANQPNINQTKTNETKPREKKNTLPPTPQGDGGDTSSQNQPSDVQDSPSTYPDYEDYTFLRFYKVYPNKARKQKAYEAWIALRDKGWLPPFDDLIHSLKAQVNHYGWNLPGREVFCESLDKWLTGRRWEDDCPDTPYQREPTVQAMASAGKPDGFNWERQMATNEQVLAELEDERQQKRISQEKAIENT